VAALLFLVIGGLSTPGLLHQWRKYQIAACANNLRLYWESLNRYSDQHEEAFPRVEAHGPRSVAGIFIPILNESGVLSPDVSVLCPAVGQQPATRLTASQLEAMADKQPQAFAALAPDLAGSYAYSLGYNEGFVLCGLRRNLGDQLPIMADRSRYPQPGTSINHGGSGQNVLYIGGNVRWCTQRTVGLAGDDIYINQLDQLRAGINRGDTVLAPSDTSP
jgi:hypothetical protein